MSTCDLDFCPERGSFTQSSGSEAWFSPQSCSPPSVLSPEFLLSPQSSSLSPAPRPQHSALRPQSCSPSSALSTPPSVLLPALRLPSSVLRPPSSVLCPLSPASRLVERAQMPKIDNQKTGFLTEHEWPLPRVLLLRLVSPEYSPPSQNASNRKSPD